MQKIRNCILFLLILVASASYGQSKQVVLDYINAYKDIAIAEMQRTGVPASITLAQGIHESGAGASQLVLESNNHFGIKCKSNWTGESVKHDDDAKGECFRKYTSAADSYKDHSDFLKSGQRYAFLFSLDPTDYTGWANGLKKAGYATNPKYPQILIKTIEDYNLQDYTMIALGKTQRAEVVDAEVVPQSPVYGIAVAVPAVVKTEEVKQNYPAGEFKLNDTKVVFVKKGTSFLAVAKQYDVDLSKIFEFNEMPKAEATDKDQLIYLQRKRKTGIHEFHVVLPGETLNDIAQQEAMRLESLQELNWLKKDEKPAVGEKLSLQAKSPTIPKLAVKDSYTLTPAIK